MNRALGEPMLGAHVFADLCDIEPHLLRDVERIETILVDAAREAGATVLGAHLHRFGGAGGVTGVVMLAESHITVHTWPEFGVAAVDAFMCGQADAMRAVALIAIGMNARVAQQTMHARGGKV
jgi:S-adenosylmethionine decarboxylase